MINIFFLFAKLNLLFLSFLGDAYEVSHITSSPNPIIYCNDIIVPTNLDGCEGVFNLKSSAMNGGLCTNGEVLQWLVSIDKNGDGSIDVEYSSLLPRNDNNIVDDTDGNGIVDAFIPPTYDGQEQIIPSYYAQVTDEKSIVVWTVTDGCGNTSSCTSTYKIMDKKSPTPYCVSQSGASLQEGKAVFFAIDFDKGSYDNCTPQNELLFTMDGERPVLSKIKTEIHYFKGKGIEATEQEYLTGDAQMWIPAYRSSCKIYRNTGEIAVKINVWDEYLNTDFCNVNLKINEQCAVSLSGNIVNIKNDPIENVNVKIDGNINGYPITEVFDSNYFFIIMEGGDYKIEPIKTDDYSSGINTIDLAMLQNHLSGNKKLTTPEQLIAADVNGDGVVSNSDYYELKKMVLGMIDKFSKNRSWTFIPKSYVYPDPAHPYSAPRYISVNVYSHLKNIDFIGIKIGDLDGSTLTKH